jgi:cytoplasmic iron level regulating protein YaaA (DUF328/UPF0246 family)
MKIIISPAKKMKIIDDVVIQCTTPLFLLKTTKLLHHLQSLDYEELKSYLKCSDTIAKNTYEQFHNMHLDKNLTPAILSYSGIQYQYMAPHVFTDDQMKYIQEHLYILSGFYGLLKPLDAITPYRLEMQTKCPFSLYEFWKDDLANQIDEPILNLASEEYARIIRKYKPLMDVRFIEENGKEKGVYAKMARGAMVRYLAENNIQDIKDITKFSDLGYTFDESQSTEKMIIFKKKLSS